jgi:hypothetical protein
LGGSGIARRRSKNGNAAAFALRTPKKVVNPKIQENKSMAEENVSLTSGERLGTWNAMKAAAMRAALIPALGDALTCEKMWQRSNRMKARLMRGRTRR